MPFTDQKTKVGRVVSTKMQKTIVVTVESQHHHRIYKHTIRVTKRFKVHDEHNECREGDTVRIVETRPLSKEKRWMVLEIIKHDERLQAQVDLREAAQGPGGGV